MLIEYQVFALTACVFAIFTLITLYYSKIKARLYFAKLRRKYNDHS